VLTLSPFSALSRLGVGDAARVLHGWAHEEGAQR